MERFMISIDRERLDEARPLLARQGLSVSSFFRKAIQDFIEAEKRRDGVMTITDLEGLR